jgi:rhamnose transport system permease protein
MSAAAQPTGGRRLALRLDTLLRARELGIALVILVVFFGTVLRTSNFASSASIRQLFMGAALIALLGVGETMVIVTRNVDLSVGSVLGLTAYLVGDLFKHYPHMPVILAFVVAIAVGGAIGAVNGLVTTVAGVPSLVVTLAMLYIIRGVDGVIVNGVQIDPSALPGGFTEFGYRTILGVPWLVLIVAVVVLFANYALRTFRAGRDLYGIGSNPEAAALAGIRSRWRVFWAFVMSGALAGLAGALFLALHA